VTNETEQATEVAGPEAFRVRAATIEIAAGPDAGRSARIARPTFVVGSGQGADLRLTDPKVSREHLRLSLTESGVEIRDAGSRNGTRIGSILVSRAVLTADTAIELGRTSLLLRLDLDPIDLPLSGRTEFGGAFGGSPGMRHVFALLERAAPSEVTVLLEGESGVGKEVLARAIHDRSTRAEQPFVALDCGAIPAGLIEAELFGHERGAFTGAERARVGIFEQAAGGTVFLDEIGELPLDMQPKLLRVLEQREVRPVGGRVSRPIDVRIVAATNKNLADASARGDFRPDLFYRLAVARVTVPPLRDRGDDIAPLARRFLRSALRDPGAELPPELASMLTAYAWPGNVRELRNVIERWAVLGARDAETLFDTDRVRLPGRADLAELPYHEARRIVLEAFERDYVPKVLERAGGVVTRAAELAEVARPSFYRMLDRANVARGSNDDD
jgi:transcriptional regulator with PAS, ATPase and Fis domain